MRWPAKVPAGFVPAPTVADVVRFMEIIRRLDHGERYAYKPSPGGAVTANRGCGPCAEGRHCSEARVGPYVLCRCLHCPVVTVREA